MTPDLNDTSTYQLVPKLKENGSIDKSQFTMHLRDNETESWIEFGTPSDDSKYVWVDLTEEPILWSINLRTSNIEEVNPIEASGLVFDSSNSYSYIPDADLDTLNSYMNSEMYRDPCSITDYILSCSCTNTTDIDATFPAIELVSGSSSNMTTFNIMGSDYMYWSNSTSSCISYFMSSPNSV
jgi:chorismate mutase